MIFVLYMERLYLRSVDARDGNFFGNLIFHGTIFWGVYVVLDVTLLFFSRTCTVQTVLSSPCHVCTQQSLPCLYPAVPAVSVPSSPCHVCTQQSLPCLPSSPCHVCTQQSLPCLYPAVPAMSVPSSPCHVCTQQSLPCLLQLSRD